MAWHCGRTDRSWMNTACHAPYPHVCRQSERGNGKMQSTMNRPWWSISASHRTKGCWCNIRRIHCMILSYRRADRIPDDQPPLPSEYFSPAEKTYYRDTVTYLDDIYESIFVNSFGRRKASYFASILSFATIKGMISSFKNYSTVILLCCYLCQVSSGVLIYWPWNIPASMIANQHINRIASDITNQQTNETIDLTYGMTSQDTTVNFRHGQSDNYMFLPQDTMFMQWDKYYGWDINNSAISYNPKGRNILRVSNDHGIDLINTSGQTALVTVALENTLWLTGKVPIYSSDNGTDRSFHTWGSVRQTSFGNYIVFQTHHFSYFLVGESTGIFTIDSDASVATSTSVTLDISGQSNMYQMRFGNTTVARDAAWWISYASTYPWALTAGNGTKTVYAEIKDIYGNTGYIQDDILLSVPNNSPTWLRIHLNGSQSSATVFTDISGNGNNGTAFNGVTTGAINGETYMCFNGSNRYIEVNSNAWVTNYPFTMSAWIKTSSVAINGWIISFARSAAATTMYNLEHNLTFPRAKAQNTTARLATATTGINTSQRSLVTAVFTSSTSRTIYVNGGSPITNTTSATFNASTNRRNIGRFADSTPSNYFNGCVDDVRIYNTDLTAWQIYDLYTRPATLSTTLSSDSSPLLRGTIGNTLDRITLTINGTTYTGTNAGNGTRSLSQWTISPALADGIYTVSMNVTNPYDRSVSYTWSLTIDTVPLTGYITYSPSTSTWMNVLATLTGVNKPFLITNNSWLTTRTFTDNGDFTYTIQDMVGNTLNITAKVTRILTWFIDISMPGTITLSTTTASQSNQTQTVWLPSMISAADRKWSSDGYYTTLQSSDIRGLNGNIVNTNVSFQASWLQLITGNTHPNIDLPFAWTTSYVDLSSPRVFISRMWWTAGIKSHYGTNGSLRVVIPGYTPPDTYQWMLTLTIYEL